MKKTSNDQLAFFLARITLGINFLIHGAIRIPKLSAFAEGMTQGFAESPLPTGLVMVFGHVLPFCEAIVGLFIFLGIKTRYALVAGALIIFVLIFGSAMKEDWGAVGTQMVYALFFFFMIKYLEHDVWGLTTKPAKPVQGFKK
ncbi:MAG: DoxX family protein [Cytophagaceae bacterium]|nr:DoxX family protein [Cytophagaceae bacterium]|tara:strand:+ start:10838 stop:11266 length:429 start_codon:yes stop_codon:yes gene_type:complete